VIGVSGGADSVCLLHALATLAAPWRLALHVAHLDHNLRPDSTAVAAHVARLAMQLSLPLHLARLPAEMLAQLPDSLESAARDARYAFLGSVARRITPPGQAPVVAVAHHADDQAETVLLNLTRGSGLRGLGGMQMVSWLPSDRFVTSREASGTTQRTVKLVRPLLYVRRQTIRDYLTAYGLVWREDSSNRDVRFARNRLRHQVLPALQRINPDVTAALCRTADILAAEAERVDRIDGRALRAIQLDVQPERVVLDLAALRELETVSQRNVLRLVLAHVAEATTDRVDAVAFAHIEMVLQHLPEAHQNSGPHPLTGDIAWTVATAHEAPTIEPARISIHRTDALPFRPRHPHLDAAWRAAHSALPVAPGDALAAPNGWLLQAHRCAVEQLPADWRSRQDPWVARLDAECAGAPQLTVPHAGMRFAPLGLNGGHKQLGDLFTDCKIHPVLRPGWPLILNRTTGHVLWVCGLRIAHTARITPTTRTVLSLSWTRTADSSSP